MRLDNHVVYRPGYFTVHPPPPPRLQVDQNFLTQKIVADPKMRCHQKSFGIWRVTEAILGKKTCFFSKNIFWDKFIRNHTIFLILDMHFLDTNAVILKNQKYLLKCVCIYRENNPNGEFFSNFLQVSKFMLY